jgi:putative Ca2+/H+ antiporter (TMEM165/GDT1 family)
MKKIIAISAVVAALFATDYQAGVVFGRAHTDKYDSKYNFLNLRQLFILFGIIITKNLRKLL